MRRCVLIGAGLGALALACLVGPPRQAHAGKTRSNVVRIGLVETLFRDTPEPMVQVMMRPFKSLLQEQTGMVGQLVSGGDAEALGRSLKNDRVQLGVFHGFEFAWARIKNPDLKPLLIAVNRDRVLRAHLVVRRDSKFTTPGDLRKRSVALPRLSREHCRLFFERRCVQPGMTPEQFFARVHTPDDIEDALDDVVDGNVHAAVVDAVSLDNFRKFKPGRAAKLRTLLRSEPFPCAVVAYQRGALSEDLLRRLKAGLIAARNDPRGKQLLAMSRITCFEAVPANYEGQLEDIARAYPPPTPSE